jgi:hypothetical protein
VFKDQPISTNIDNLRSLLERTRIENLIYRLPHTYHDEHYQNLVFNGYTRTRENTGGTGNTGETGCTGNTGITGDTGNTGIIGDTPVSEEVLSPEVKPYEVVTAITISPSDERSLSEFPPGTYSEVENAANPAQISLSTLYNTIVNLESTNKPVTELGTTHSVTTLVSTGSQNVYKALSGLSVNGTLILTGGSSDRFYFISGSTIEFSTVNPVTIILSGGIQETNIFWVAQGSIGVNDLSFISGILIAEDSIIFSGTSTLFGSAFARNAIVSLENTTITTKCADVIEVYNIEPYFEVVDTRVSDEDIEIQ